MAGSGQGKRHSKLWRFIYYFSIYVLRPHDGPDSVYTYVPVSTYEYIPIQLSLDKTETDACDSQNWKKQAEASHAASP